jgi:peptide/nickel transport system permease protein
MDDSAVRRTTHTADSVSDLAESMKRTQAAVPRSISTWGRIRRNPRVVVPGIILILIVIMAITAPWIIPHDPYEMNTRVRLAGPSTTNLLGTDEYGRDLLSRVILGSRTSLVISTTSVALATAFGLILGIFGGYLGGIWELISMRLVDALLTIPPILLAITVVAFLGPGIGNLIGVIALLYMTIFARISYGATLQVKNREFVEAERVLGASTLRILWRAILPNILAPIFVQMSLSLGFAILLESGLSFLGLGTPPPKPSWGNMIGAGRGYMDQDAWYVLWPAIVISITILCCNVLGDGLRDSLDPRLKR